MTRKEKADKLGQEYFPDEANMWARPNYEAQCVSEACMKMAEWEHQRLVEKAVDWLKDNWREHIFHDADGMIGFIGWETDFRKAMKKK